MTKFEKPGTEIRKKSQFIQSPWIIHSFSNYCFFIPHEGSCSCTTSTHKCKVHQLWWTTCGEQVVVKYYLHETSCEWACFEKVMVHLLIIYQLLMVMNMMPVNGFAYVILQLRSKQDLSQIRSFISGRRVEGDSWSKAKVFLIMLPDKSHDILLHGWKWKIKS